MPPFGKFVALVVVIQHSFIQHIEFDCVSKVHLLSTFTSSYVVAPKELVSTARPSEFQFAIADRIEFLNAAVWNGLTANASVLLSRRYLSALQFEATEQILRRFAIVYEIGCSVAAVATQTFEVSGDKLTSDSSDRKLKLPVASDESPWPC